MLVFAGCGAIIADARYDHALGTVGIALVFGLVILAMVYLACEQAYGSAFKHAFRAGEHLLAAKEEVAHGDWLPWVEVNFDGSRRTAQATCDSPVREMRKTLRIWVSSGRCAS